jgi:hypothetical protein
MLGVFIFRDGVKQHVKKKWRGIPLENGILENKIGSSSKAAACKKKKARDSPRNGHI